MKRDPFRFFIEGVGEESGVTIPRRMIRVMMGLSMRRADIHLDMKAVIIKPRIKPVRLKSAIALVSLMVNLVLKPSPRKAPEIRPATGIK